MGTFLMNAYGDISNGELQDVPPPAAGNHKCRGFRRGSHAWEKGTVRLCRKPVRVYRIMMLWVRAIK